ncbi:hypothetical protein ROW45_001100 [Vibrio fluvialis]|nr:hypothetical protein [Vibrio fluvialis]
MTKKSQRRVLLSFYMLLSFLCIYITYTDLLESIKDMKEESTSYDSKLDVLEMFLQTFYLVVGVVVGNIGWDTAKLVDANRKLASSMMFTVMSVLIMSSVGIYVAMTIGSYFYMFGFNTNVISLIWSRIDMICVSFLLGMISFILALCYKNHVIKESLSSMHPDVIFSTESQILALAKKVSHLENAQEALESDISIIKFISLLLIIALIALIFVV